MRLLLLLIVSTTLLFAVSCKPDKVECHDPSNPKCENYDPCYGQKPVEAEISLAIRAKNAGTSYLITLYLNEQQIFPYSQIRFDSPLENAKYTWTLGAETITSKSFERVFDGVPFTTYSVKLVVEKEPNKNCFSTDDGIDTIVKNFRIVPVCSLAITGVFKGKWDNSSEDSALISFRSFFNQTYQDSCDFGIYRFTNLQNLGDTLLLSRGTNAISNTEFVNYNPGTLGIANVNSKINLTDKTVLMDYHIGSKHYVFRGRKIAD